MQVWLIDPSGQAQAYQSNGLITADSSGDLSLTDELGANLHVVNPAPGRWTVIITFAPTVSGTALSEPFTVSLNEFPPAVTATESPKGATLSVNHPAVAVIHVVNTGTAPEAYFVDGRTDATTQYSLAAVDSPQATVPLSVTGTSRSTWSRVETTSITGTATTRAPPRSSSTWSRPGGDPDVASGQGPR